MADLETINQRIEQLEELLFDAAGAGTITTNGITTQFNQRSAERELNRLKREKARLEGKRPGVANIDMSHG